MRVPTGPAIVALLFAACAQVRDPTGGAKDIEPPRLVAAEPPDRSTSVQPDRIVLNFNERVKLDRPGENLLVSPPLSKKPTVRLAGPGTVVIELAAPLEENTTYSFNLGDAIADLTEGNAPRGLTYVISTGAAIDSSSIHGIVVNAGSDLPEKDVLVMLYAADDDSSFQRGAPLYFTRSGATGEFRTEHLRPASYRIFALRDRNNNRRYDLPNEEIAFAGTTIEATCTDSGAAGVRLGLFLPPPTMQQLLSAKVTRDRAWQLVLALPAAHAGLDPVEWRGGELRWTVERSAGSDTFLFWPSDTTFLEGREFAVEVEGAVLDTIRYAPFAKMPFAPEVRARRTLDEDGPRVELEVSRPVLRIDGTRVLGATLVHGNSTGDADRTWTLVRAEEGPSTVVLLPNAITDIYGGQNDTLRFDAGTPGVRESGTLEVDLSGVADRPSHLVLQLINSQGVVLREEAVPVLGPKVRWPFIDPGSYSLRLLEDRNADGKWTTGSLVEGRLPEPTWRHPKPVDVRAGWDVRIEWMHSLP